MPPLRLLLAQVHTLDAARPVAEAVLVGHTGLMGQGRVLAVGTQAELRALAPRAEVEDYRSELLTPGLCDAHTHLVTHGFALSQLQLAGVGSVAEVQRRLAGYVAGVPAGEWVRGGGFLLPEMGLSEYPTAADLDAVSPRHPVALYSRDHHMLWANSLALEAAGLHADTPDPAGGQIVRPPQAAGLGTLLEGACELVTRVIPKPAQTAFVEAARTAQADLRARGFVSTHTMAFEPPEAALALQRLDAAGELALRVWACLPHSELSAAESLGLGGSGGGGLFQWGGVKFFADGALGSRTAWMHPPAYADGSGEGMSVDAPELIRERGQQALELGLTPVTHAIGSRAVSEVLDVYDALRPFARAAGVRLRMEHAQHICPQDLPRFGGLVASMQPIHMQGDAAMIRQLLPQLEPTSFACRSLLDAGAVLAFGSDAPIAPPSVQGTFAAAATRLGADGLPLAPAQALTPTEVLHAYTRGPALAAGWSDEGIIRAGSRAAFTLWDELGGECRALVYA